MRLKRVRFLPNSIWKLLIREKYSIFAARIRASLSSREKVSSIGRS